MKVEILTYDELSKIHQQKAKVKIREDLLRKNKSMGIKYYPLRVEHEVNDSIDKQIFVRLEGFAVYMFNKYECKL